MLSRGLDEWDRSVESSVRFPKIHRVTSSAAPEQAKLLRSDILKHAFSTAAVT